jgi:hypothetical protein
MATKSGAGRRPRSVEGPTESKSYSLVDAYHKAIADYADRNAMSSNSTALELLVQLGLAVDTVDVRARAQRREITLPEAARELVEIGASIELGAFLNGPEEITEIAGAMDLEDLARAILDRPAGGFIAAMAEMERVALRARRDLVEILTHLLPSAQPAELDGPLDVLAARGRTAAEALSAERRLQAERRASQREIPLLTPEEF